jgi:RND family efflux transporter MFP subunit
MRTKGLVIGIAEVALLVLIGIWLWSSRQEASGENTNQETSQHDNHQMMEEDQRTTEEMRSDHGGEVDYYTCSMHPSVKSKDPGRCPVCSMDLIPVMKQAMPEKKKVDLSFAVSPQKQQLIGVRFSTVAYQPMHKIIRAVGRVAYDETRLSVVNLKIGGWIEKLYADYTGRFVRKGEPLFEMYSPELVSTQEEYLLALKSNKSSDVLQTARQRLLLWDITEEQLETLEKRKVPDRTWAIEAPRSGYVIEKMAIEGMRVEPGMDLYKIADLSTVWVYADVYEFELPLVRLGQEAVITVASMKAQALKGRITYIAPTLDPMTRTARVRIEVPNRDGLLKPEMFADVEIHQMLGKKLAIPESAVLDTGVRQIVFVNKGDGMFEVRLVTLGLRAEDLIEVRDGLEPGERVVSAANFLIDAESRVQGVLQRLEGGGAEAPPPVGHQH